MHVLDVIPLTALPAQGSQILSYFCASDLPRGAVVEISLNHRLVPGVVVDNSELTTRKIAVKKSSFQLKPITRVISEEALVSTWQLRLAGWIARRYYAPLGLALKSVLPVFWNKRNHRTAPLPPGPTNKQTTDTEAAQTKTNTIFASSDQWAHHIEKIIAQTSSQVIVLVPAAVIASDLARQLAHHHPITGTSELTTKSLRQGWDQSVTARVIIGTRIVLNWPYTNPAAMIVVDPTDDGYKSDMTPRVHAATLAHHIATSWEIPYYAVTRPPVITMDTPAPHLNRTAQPTLVSLSRERAEGRLTTISQTLEHQLFAAIKRNEPVLLLSSRKAFRTMYTCRTCSWSVSCPNCALPLRSHQHIRNETMLVCYRCGTFQNPPTICPQCKNKNLAPSGPPGSQQIVRDVETLLEYHKLSAPVVIFDNDLIRTPKQEHDAIAAIRALPKPHVIVATTKILDQRLALTFPLVGVTSADTLAATVDYRADEQTISTLEKLFDFHPNEYIIQTYNPERPLFQVFQHNHYREWLNDELASRQKYGYPPFTKLVTASFAHGNQQRARTHSQEVAVILRQAIPRGTATLLGPLPAFVAREHAQWIYRLVIKHTLDDRALHRILELIPSTWSIDIEPRIIA